MSPPRTYAEWLGLLDRFRRGDDDTLEAMRGGAIEWTNVVAERWVKHLSEALQERLRTMGSQLQRTLDHSGGDAAGISGAMLSARRRLEPLRQFASLPAIPPDVQAYLMSEVSGWAAGTQRSLERHAEKVRDDHGRLLKTIRDNRIDAAVAAPLPQPDLPPATGSGGRGRRVIL